MKQQLIIRPSLDDLKNKQAIRKKYSTKWSRAGVDKMQRRMIYERLRVRAFLILKSKHQKEYKKIISNLIKMEVKNETSKNSN